MSSLKTTQLTCFLARAFLCSALPCLAPPCRDALLPLPKAVDGGLCAVVAAFAMIGWNAIITEVGGWKKAMRLLYFFVDEKTYQYTCYIFPSLVINFTFATRSKHHNHTRNIDSHARAHVFGMRCLHQIPRRRNEHYPGFEPRWFFLLKGRNNTFRRRLVQR